MFLFCINIFYLYSNSSHNNSQIFLFCYPQQQNQWCVVIFFTKKILLILNSDSNGWEISNFNNNDNS